MAGSGVPSQAVSDSATQYDGAHRCIPRQVGGFRVCGVSVILGVVENVGVWGHVEQNEDGIMWGELSGIGRAVVSRLFFLDA